MTVVVEYGNSQGSVLRLSVSESEALTLSKNLISCVEELNEHNYPQIDYVKIIKDSNETHILL